MGNMCKGKEPEKEIEKEEEVPKIVDNLTKLKSKYQNDPNMEGFLDSEVFEESTKMKRSNCKVMFNEKETDGYFLSVPGKEENMKVLITNSNDVKFDAIPNEKEVLVRFKSEDESELTKTLSLNKNERGTVALGGSDIQAAVIQMKNEDDIPKDNFLEIHKEYLDKMAQEKEKIKRGESVEHDPEIEDEIFKVMADHFGWDIDKDPQKIADFSVYFNNILEKIPKHGLEPKRKHILKCVYDVKKNKPLQLFNSCFAYSSEFVILLDGKEIKPSPFRGTSWRAESGKNNITPGIKNVILYYYGENPIKSSLFKDSDSLISVDFSNFDLELLTSFKELFYDCKALNHIEFGQNKTSHITDMSYMFYGCEALKKFDMSVLDTSNVETMEGMFGFCSNLELANLSSISTKNVKNMHLMFQYCPFTNIDLSGFDTSNVENMSEMFSNCNKLTEIDLTSFDVKKVKDFSNMFAHCSSLANLKGMKALTESVNKLNKRKDSKQQKLFTGCPKLKVD